MTFTADDIIAELAKLYPDRKGVVIGAYKLAASLLYPDDTLSEGVQNVIDDVEQWDNDQAELRAEAQARSL
jgi:hypothetical protein